MINIGKFQNLAIKKINQFDNNKVIITDITGNFTIQQEEVAFNVTNLRGEITDSDNNIIYGNQLYSDGVYYYNSFIINNNLSISNGYVQSNNRLINNSNGKLLFKNTYNNLVSIKNRDNSDYYNFNSTFIINNNSKLIFNPSNNNSYINNNDNSIFVLKSDFSSYVYNSNYTILDFKLIGNNLLLLINNGINGGLILLDPNLNNIPLNNIYTTEQIQSIYISNNKIYVYINSLRRIDTITLNINVLAITGSVTFNPSTNMNYSNIFIDYDNNLYLYGSGIINYQGYSFNNLIRYSLADGLLNASSNNSIYPTIFPSQYNFQAISIADIASDNINYNNFFSKTPYNDVVKVSASVIINSDYWCTSPLDLSKGTYLALYNYSNSEIDLGYFLGRLSNSIISGSTATTYSNPKFYEPSNNSAIWGNITGDIYSQLDLQQEFSNIIMTGSGAWGSITGNINNQTDLQNKFSTYTPTSSFNTLSQSIQLYDSEISIYSTGSTPPILGTDYNINNKILNIINTSSFNRTYPELYSRRWRQTSQTTGNFFSLLLSGSVMFAGSNSNNGIYSSSNGGLTWGQTSQTTGNFTTLLLSGSVIFAGSNNGLGIYSSSNGGVTWSQTSQTIGSFFSLLLSGSVMFAGSNSNNGIYSSSNGGLTWGQTSQTTGYFSLLLSGSTIFAGSNSGIYLSSNGGVTWSQTSQTTGNFPSLLLSGSTIFAGSNNGIYSSSNGGSTWGLTSQTTGNFYSLLLSGSTIFAGSQNNIGIYSSSNGGSTWSQTSQTTGNFTSLLLSGSVIFSGNNSGNGIYSSSLSLNSIYENKIYISNNTSSVVGTLPITDNTAYKVDSSSFDLRSINNSQSLNTYSSSIGVISSSFNSRIISGSQSLNTYTPTSSFNTLSQSIQLYDSEISIYSTGSTPPILGTDYNINNKILNIINNNKFSTTYPELYNKRWVQTSQNTGYFTALLLSGSVMFAGNNYFSPQGIYSSSNGGVTWGQTSQTTGNFSSFLLSGSVIFAGSINGIYSSSNGGSTWSQTSQTTGTFTSLLLSGSIMFATNNSDNTGIYSSSNGGSTWSQTSQNTGYFSSLLLSGSIIFAGSDSGIYSSSNGGVTWGLTSQNTGDFSTLFLSGSTIFAGSNSNNGIYSSSNGGVTWSQTSQTTGTFYSLLLSGSKIYAGSDNGIYYSSKGNMWDPTPTNTGTFYSLLLSGSVIFAGSQNNGIYSSSLSLNSIYENKIYISNNTSSVVGTLPITDNNAYKVDSSSFDNKISNIISTSARMLINTPIFSYPISIQGITQNSTITPIINTISGSSISTTTLSGVNGNCLVITLPEGVYAFKVIYRYTFTNPNNVILMVFQNTTVGGFTAVPTYPGFATENGLWGSGGDQHQLIAESVFSISTPTAFIGWIYCSSGSTTGQFNIYIQRLQ